jgi:hypothetical protein
VNEVFSLKEAFDNTGGKVPSIRKYLKNTEFFEKISGGQTADKVIYKRLKFPDEIYKFKM